jgi:hypothetical protein
MKIKEIMDLKKPNKFTELLNLKLAPKLIKIDQRKDEYEITFSVNKKQYVFSAYYDKEITVTEIWMVEFFYIEEHESGFKKRIYNITDTGDQFLVFQGVGWCLKRFLEKYEPDQFMFMAKEVSRVKLYKVFVREIEKQTNYTSRDIKTFGDETFFTFISENSIYSKRENTWIDTTLKAEDYIEQVHEASDNPQIDKLEVDKLQIKQDIIDLQIRKKELDSDSSEIENIDRNIADLKTDIEDIDAELQALKQSESIVESVPDIVYHATSTEKAFDIIRTNEFRLTPTMISTSDSKFRSDKLYFLSLSRIKYGGYTRAMGDTSHIVILEIDGRKLSQRYKGHSVDYWGAGMRSAKGLDMEYKLRNDENEERVYSDDPTIPKATQYIKSIHIYVTNEDDIYGPASRNPVTIANYGKKIGLPVAIYTDFSAFKTLNARKAYINTATADQAENKYLFTALVELWYDPSIVNNLSSRVRHYVYDLARKVSYGMDIETVTQDLYKLIQIEVHNDNTQPLLRVEMDKFFKLVKKYGKGDLKIFLIRLAAKVYPWAVEKINLEVYLKGGSFWKE